MDLKQMMIWGNVVSAERSKQAEDEPPDLVPKSWHLVRRSADGQETILAKGVLCYDLAPDGTVVYSNGSAVFVIDPQQRRHRAAAESMIEQLVILKPGPPQTPDPPAADSASA